MEQLSQTDLRLVLSRVPKDVRELMQAEEGLILAGGFIRETIAGNEVKDIDLCGPNRDRMNALAERLKLHKHRDGSRTHYTTNATTLITPNRTPVQFIHRWLFETAKACIDSLDFTVCQAAVWYEKGSWRSVCAPTFYQDLAAKRLRYTFPVRIEEAGGSTLRVLKFVKRGYNIQPEEFGKVLARLAFGVDSSKLAESNEEGLGKVFGGLLREVDPLMIVDGMEPIDEHATLEDL